LEMERTAATTELANVRCCQLHAGEVSLRSEEEVVAQLRGDIAELKATIHELVESKENALNELQASTASSLLQKQEEVNELERVLQESTDALVELNTAISTSAATEISLEQRLQEKELSITEWEGKYNALTITNEGTISQLQEFQEANVAAKKSHGEMESRVKELTVGIESDMLKSKTAEETLALKQALTMKQGRIDDLESTMLSLTRQVEEMTAERAATESSSHDALVAEREAIATLSRSQNKVDKLEQCVVELKAQEVQCMERHDEAIVCLQKSFDVVLAEKQSETEALEQRMVDHETRNNENWSETRTQLQQKQVEIARLESESAELKATTREQVSDLEYTIAELKGRLVEFAVQGEASLTDRKTLDTEMMAKQERIERKHNTTDCEQGKRL
jgi:chromosome segregation ATPase